MKLPLNFAKSFVVVQILKNNLTQTRLIYLFLSTLLLLMCLPLSILQLLHTLPILILHNTSFTSAFFIPHMHALLQCMLPCLQLLEDGGPLTIQM